MNYSGYGQPTQFMPQNYGSPLIQQGFGQPSFAQPFGGYAPRPMTGGGFAPQLGMAPQVAGPMMPMAMMPLGAPTGYAPAQTAYPSAARGSGASTPMQPGMFGQAPMTTAAMAPATGSFFAQPQYPPHMASTQRSMAPPAASFMAMPPPPAASAFQTATRDFVMSPPVASRDAPFVTSLGGNVGALSPQAIPNGVSPEKLGVDPKFFGVWDRSDGFTNEERPLVRGWGSGVKWSDFEPRSGAYQWNLIEESLNKAGEAGKGWYGMIHVGPDSPQWIYDQGVPKVQTNDKKANHAKMQDAGFPYYLSPQYKELFFRMVSTYAQWLRSHRFAQNIVFVQANFGCTGDATLYKGDPTKEQYAISDEQANAFAFEVYNKFKEAFQTGPGRRIPILVNAETDELEQWCVQNIPLCGIKGSAFCRGHHLSGERSWIQQHQHMMLQPRNDNRPFVFTRTEMDQTWSGPSFATNIPLSYYWGVINGINQGLAVHDVSYDALDQCFQQDFAESLMFFNKYAPQIWPQTATNAMIAFHKGLDASDTDAYPIAKYGRSQSDRLKSITKDYAKFGARIDDETAANRGQVYQRSSQKGYNDAGSDIWPGNYSRWLEQIDPDETSQAWWRIGGTIKQSTSKYARFGRGLYHSSSKNAIYLKLTDGFFEQSPPGALAVRIVWYDCASGSWQLDYNNKQGQAMTALKQPCSGDNTWKEANFTIQDGAMNHSYTRGCDFLIRSQDSSDIIFHMVEITRGGPAVAQAQAAQAAATSQPAPGAGVTSGRKGRKGGKNAPHHDEEAEFIESGGGKNRKKKSGCC